VFYAGENHADVAECLAGILLDDRDFEKTMINLNCLPSNIFWISAFAIKLFTILKFKFLVFSHEASPVKVSGEEVSTMVV